MVQLHRKKHLLHKPTCIQIKRYTNLSIFFVLCYFVVNNLSSFFFIILAIKNPYIKKKHRANAKLKKIYSITYFNKDSRQDGSK